MCYILRRTKKKSQNKIQTADNIREQMVFLTIILFITKRIIVVKCLLIFSNNVSIGFPISVILHAAPLRVGAVTFSLKMRYDDNRVWDGKRGEIGGRE